MRVLVVTSMYPTEQLPHLGAYVAEQVRSLRAAGVDADVLFINARRTRLNYVLSLPHVVRKLRTKRYDIIHTHHTYTIPLVRMARALTRGRMPIVLTSHEGEAVGGTPPTWHPTSQIRHSIGVKRWMARGVDYMVFVSRQLSDAIGSNGSHDVIPCGVDLEKFKPMDQARCRAQLGLPAEALILFYPASPRARAKRFELVETAYGIVRKRRPNAQLLTGGGIPHAMMPVYYNAADVVLQSSFYEASPTVVKEALACERPVVSTDSGDTREIMAGVPYCFVCADDPEELAHYAIVCTGHRAIGGRERLIAKGLGLEQVAERLTRIYRTLEG